MKINFAITTCKRLELFKRMMDSFLCKCKDLELIDRWILVDDNSCHYDLVDMKERHPFFEIHVSKNKGQAASINLLNCLIDSEWFFKCEDDWEFVKDFYIKDLLQIAQENEMVKNVTLRNWKNIEDSYFYQTSNGLNYLLHTYISKCGNKKIVDETNCRWYGYIHNPGIQHTETIRMLGEYDENYNIECRRWDRVQAKRYYLLGYKVANMVDTYIKHVGEGKSIYVD